MLKPGIELNQTYRVERLLGQGGMASVFEVSHLRFSKRFALKIITTRFEEEPHFRARFKREAELLGSLTHHNIVTIIDWNEYEDRPYLVMELLQGGDLAQMLDRGQQISMKTALTICKQLGDALSAAHARGIIHRDLKPANLFLCQAESSDDIHLKVLDFGLARPTTKLSGVFRTEDSWIAGTPAYMSPEQASGHRDLDPRSDQFSIAVIIWEILTGQRLFAQPGDSIPTILYRITHEEPPPLTWPLLDTVLRRALSKDKTNRYESIRAFTDALLATGRDMLEGRPSTPAVTVSDLGRSAAETQAIGKQPRVLRRWHGIAAFLGVFAVLLGFGIGLKIKLWRAEHEANAGAAIKLKEALRKSSIAEPGPSTTAEQAVNSPHGAAFSQGQGQGERLISLLDEPQPSKPPLSQPKANKQTRSETPSRPLPGSARPTARTPALARSNTTHGESMLRVGDGDARQKRAIRQCFEKSLGKQLTSLRHVQILLRGISALRIIRDVNSAFPPQYRGPVENCLREEGNLQMLPFQTMVFIGESAP